MTDEIRVDTSRLRDHIDALYVEKALADELSERLEHVKYMVSVEYSGDVAYAEQKARNIYDFISGMAESMTFIINIFEALDKELSQMMQECLDEAQKE